MFSQDAPLPLPVLGFSASGVWGDFFELDIDLGAPAVETLQRAALALWDHPDLEGCWTENKIEPVRASAVRPEAWTRYIGQEGGVCYGLARVPGIGVTPCLVSLCIGSDYMTMQLCLSMKAIGSVVRVGAYPFDDGTPTDWIIPTSAWLAGVASVVHQASPLVVGVIGWEGDSGEAKRFRTEGVPQERWVGYVVPSGKEVEYYPPNILTPPMT